MTNSNVQDCPPPPALLHPPQYSPISKPPLVSKTTVSAPPPAPLRHTRQISEEVPKDCFETLLVLILEIGEPLSKYWNIYWILVAKAAGKPTLSLAAVKSGKKVPNFSESVLNDL